MINIDNMLANIIKPEMLDYYKERAVADIVNYLNIKAYTSKDIMDKYPIAIVEMCKYYVEIDKQGNLTTRTQGQRSETFKAIELGVPSKVKGLLPKPRMRVK